VVSGAVLPSKGSPQLFEMEVQYRVLPTTLRLSLSLQPCLSTQDLGEMETQFSEEEQSPYSPTPIPGHTVGLCLAISPARAQSGVLLKLLSP
jgi:hypothetical protein